MLDRITGLYQSCFAGVTPHSTSKEAIIRQRHPITIRILIILLCGYAGLTSADETPPVAVATFAGGCFWCMEPPYDKTEGVLSTTSGYTGGSERDPSYRQVSSGRTGHTEAVQIRYNPQRVNYQTLVDLFWRNIDPTAKNRQFCDTGSQYRSAIFYHDEEQKRIAEESLARLQANPPFKGEIVTEIVAAGPFYPAEEYHQDYYLKNPVRYNYYRFACGRDRRLEQLWGEK